MKRKELFWMLVPCLVFAGMALWMRAREARLPSDGKFHLVIEKIETPPITAKDAADGYDTEVAVTLNYIGPKPEWWGKQDGAFGDYEGGAHLFYEAEGKSKRVKLPPDFKNEPPIFYWHPSWQKDTERYKARFFLPLSKLPPRVEKTVLRAPLAIEDGSLYPHKILSEPAPLVFTVREAKQTIKPADVPRNPLLKILKAEVIKTTAAQRKANGGSDTEVNVYLQDLGPSEAKGSASGSYELVDETGKRIPYSGGSGAGNRGGSYSPILFFECSRSVMPKSQRNIFVRLKFSRGDRWPLFVRVPLRQDGKNLSGIVKAKAEPTRSNAKNYF